ncbi:MAG TPA: hypothetical protein VNT26_21180, partial [Candidatus Sulfotelmatobacter sp.]|nr:hypothetical protein [Candidatus Sulfotelmatobacter sp.]
LRQSLESFQGQHPRVFKDAQAQSQQAQQAMDKAAQALQSRSPDAPNATQQAAQQMEKFSDAMQQQAAEQQLADAYKLKQMLDQQIQALDRQARSGPQPGKDDPQKTAQQARETIDQLKNTAEQEPARNAFGPPLREALSGQKKADLDAKLAQLQQAQDAATQQQRAAEAKEGLGQVSKAFEASQPKGLQAAREKDALQPDQQDSFSQGMAELDSLIKQLENHRPLSPEDQAKQGKQALANLQTGLRSQQGDNSGGNQIMLHLQQLLQAEGPLDVGDLKKLMEQLQRFSVESSEQLAKKEDKPELTNIDPTRLPPAYRGRIQKYFQKLSEQ